MVEGKEENSLWESERLEKLKEGDLIDTPGGDPASMEIPLWYDEKLFKKAKEVFKDYFASILFSHMCGLLMFFYFTKSLKTLKSTGESDTKYNLFHRYLATVRYVRKWYEGDVWDVKDPAHKSLSAVRSMHAKVANKMAELNDGVVYVSQWEMAVTQWAFVGPMVLFRSKVGLHSCTEEQYESLIHFWRVIGYLLGIEDQYNLCTGDYEQVLAACKLMLEKEYKERMAISDPSSIDMAENVANAMTLVIPLLTWESMAPRIYELVGVPCPVRIKFIDWIYHSLMQFVMIYVIQIPSLRALYNDFFRWRLSLADKRDLEFKQQKKYIYAYSKKVSKDD